MKINKNKVNILDLLYSGLTIIDRKDLAKQVDCSLEEITKLC